jgi:hypothetical protein
MVIQSTIDRHGMEICARPGNSRSDPFDIPRSALGFAARVIRRPAVEFPRGGLLSCCCWPRRAVQLPGKRPQTKANHAETD